MRLVLPQNVHKANKDSNVSTTATRLRSLISEGLVRCPQQLEGCKGRACVTGRFRRHSQCLLLLVLFFLLSLLFLL